MAFSKVSQKLKPHRSSHYYNIRSQYCPRFNFGYYRLPSSWVATYCLHECIPIYIYHKYLHLQKQIQHYYHTSSSVISIRIIKELWIHLCSQQSRLIFQYSITETPELSNSEHYIYMSVKQFLGNRACCSLIKCRLSFSWKRCESDVYKKEIYFFVLCSNRSVSLWAGRLEKNKIRCVKSFCKVHKVEKKKT